MKRPLKDHKQSLWNMRKHHERLEVTLQRAQEDVARSAERIRIAAAQVERAEREGLTEFDSERFNVPRAKKP